MRAGRGGHLGSAVGTGSGSRGNGVASGGFRPGALFL
jgi:hypothetical protein